MNRKSIAVVGLAFLLAFSLAFILPNVQTVHAQSISEDKIQGSSACSGGTCTYDLASDPTSGQYVAVTWGIEGSSTSCTTFDPTVAETGVSTWNYIVDASQDYGCVEGMYGIAGSSTSNVVTVTFSNHASGANPQGGIFVLSGITGSPVYSSGDCTTSCGSSFTTGSVSWTGDGIAIAAVTTETSASFTGGSGYTLYFSTSQVLNGEYSTSSSSVSSPTDFPISQFPGPWAEIGMVFYQQTVTVGIQVNFNAGISLSPHMAISGCGVSNSTLYADNSTHVYTSITPDCDITITNPSTGSSYTEYVFASGVEGGHTVSASSWTFETCGSGTCSSVTNETYYQLKNTFQVVAKAVSKFDGATTFSISNVRLGGTSSTSAGCNMVDPTNASDSCVFWTEYDKVATFPSAIYSDASAVRWDPTGTLTYTVTTGDNSYSVDYYKQLSENYYSYIVEGENTDHGQDNAVTGTSLGSGSTLLCSSPLTAYSFKTNDTRCGGASFVYSDYNTYAGFEEDYSDSCIWKPIGTTSWNMTAPGGTYDGTYEATGCIPQGPSLVSSSIVTSHAGSSTISTSLYGEQGNLLVVSVACNNGTYCGFLNWFPNFGNFGNPDYEDCQIYVPTLTNALLKMNFSQTGPFGEGCVGTGGPGTGDPYGEAVLQAWGGVVSNNGTVDVSFTSPTGGGPMTLTVMDFSQYNYAVEKTLFLCGYNQEGCVSSGSDAATNGESCALNLIASSPSRAWHISVGFSLTNNQASTGDWKPTSGAGETYDSFSEHGFQAEYNSTAQYPYETSLPVSTTFTCDYGTYYVGGYGLVFSGYDTYIPSDLSPTITGTGQITNMDCGNCVIAGTGKYYNFEITGYDNFDNSFNNVTIAFNDTVHYFYITYDFNTSSTTLSGTVDSAISLGSTSASQTYISSGGGHYDIVVNFSVTFNNAVVGSSDRSIYALYCTSSICSNGGSYELLDNNYFNILTNGGGDTQVIPQGLCSHIKGGATYADVCKYDASPTSLIVTNTTWAYLQSYSTQFSLLYNISGVATDSVHSVIADVGFYYWDGSTWVWGPNVVLSPLAGAVDSTNQWMEYNAEFYFGTRFISNQTIFVQWEPTYPNYQTRFYLDIWYSNVNDSTTWGMRVNAMFVGMNNKCSWWNCWFASGWSPLYQNASTAETFGTLYNHLGDVISSTQITCTKVGWTVAMVKDLSFAFTSNSFQIQQFNLASTPQQMQGVATPVYTAPLIPTISSPNIFLAVLYAVVGGLASAILSAFSAFGTVVLAALNSQFPWLVTTLSDFAKLIIALIAIVGLLVTYLIDLLYWIVGLYGWLLYPVDIIITAYNTVVGIYVGIFGTTNVVEFGLIIFIAIFFTDVLAHMDKGDTMWFVMVAGKTWGFINGVFTWLWYIAKFFVDTIEGLIP